MACPYPYIVFDLDGTLMNTYPGVALSFTKTEEELGLRHLSQQELCTVIGPALEDSFRRLYGLEGAENQRALDAFNRLYATMEGAGNSPLYPGMEEMLRELKAQGCRLAIATMKPAIFTRICLEAKGLSGFFDAVACYEDNSNISKGQLILRTLGEMGGSPQRAVMIGDTAGDCRGAVEAGLDFVGVTWGFGYNAQNRPEEDECAACADTVDELWAFLADRPE